MTSLVVIGADPVYFGNLLLVGPRYVSIRVADGRVISARLPNDRKLSPDALLSQYKIGDQVELKGKTINSPLDAELDYYFSLELKSLRFLRAATPDEMRGVARALFWKTWPNLLPGAPKAAPWPHSVEPPGLDRVREVNLEAASKIVNFIAQEKAVRSQTTVNSTRVEFSDTVESEIAFQGESGARQNVRINGKAWTSKSSWLPGVNWGLSFGGKLKPLFHRDCGNTFEFAGEETVRGKPAQTYRFKSPLDGCFGPGQIGATQFNAPVSGRFLADDAGNVVRLESFSHNLPVDFGLSASADVLKWDYVKIGDDTHLLPVGASYRFAFLDGRVWNIEVQYTNHRHFESSIELRFDR